jgi:hypothetical protein
MISPARDPLRLFVTPYFYQRFTFSTAMLADRMVGVLPLLLKWERCVNQYRTAAVSPITSDFIRRLAEYTGRPLDDMMPTHSFAQYIGLGDDVASDTQHLQALTGYELVCFTLVWGVLRKGVTVSTHREESTT